MRVSVFSSVIYVYILVWIDLGFILVWIGEGFMGEGNERKGGKEKEKRDQSYPITRNPNRRRRVIKHAHLKRQRDLKRRVVQIRRWRPVRTKRPNRHSRREDKRRDIARKRNDGRNNRRRFGRSLRYVVCDRTRRLRHGRGDDVVCILDRREGGDNVRGRDGGVGLDEVARGDEGAGYGRGGVGEGFRRDGVFGAGGVDDAGVEGLQNDGRRDGAEEAGCCCCCVAAGSR